MLGPLETVLVRLRRPPVATGAAPEGAAATERLERAADRAVEQLLSRMARSLPKAGALLAVLDRSRAAEAQWVAAALARRVPVPTLLFIAAGPTFTEAGDADSDDLVVAVFDRAHSLHAATTTDGTDALTQLGGALAGGLGALVLLEPERTVLEGLAALAGPRGPALCGGGAAVGFPLWFVANGVATRTVGAALQRRRGSSLLVHGVGMRELAPPEPAELAAAEPGAPVGGRVVRVGAHRAFDRLTALAPGDQRQLFVTLHTDDEAYPLVRSLRGVDPSSGVLSLTGPAPAGVRIAFAVPDAGNGRTELGRQLRELKARLAGALLVSALITEHGARDAELNVTALLRRELGPVPVLGLRTSFGLLHWHGEAQLQLMGCSISALASVS